MLELDNKRRIFLLKCLCHSINYTIGGTFTEDEVDLISFDILRCDNATSKVKSLSDDEIAKKLSLEGGVP